MQKIQQKIAESEELPDKMANQEFIDKYEFKVIQPNIDHIYFQPRKRKKPCFTFAKEKRKRRTCLKRVENRTLDSLMNIINFKAEQKDKNLKKGHVHYKDKLLKIKDELGA